MPSEMSQQAYVDAMVAYGGALLAPPPGKTGTPVANDERARWLDRMVDYGRQLRASAVAAPTGRTSSRGLNDFRRLFMQEPDWLRRRLRDSLAERRAALSVEAERWLGVLETTPDLLAPMDFIRYEPIHTRLVAWCLRPGSLPGGLADSLLRALLSRLAATSTADLPAADEPLGQVTVVPEKTLGDLGRADIWIEMPDVVIVIEAKVDAKERDGQVSDYRLAVERYAGQKQALPVFLSVPGDRSETDPDATPLAFRDLLELWLPIAVSGDTHEHRYLRHYLATIARHMYGLAGDGPYDNWAPNERRLALNFLSEHFS